MASYVVRRSGPVAPSASGQRLANLLWLKHMFRAEQSGEGVARLVATSGPVQGAKEGMVRPAAVGEDPVPDAADALGVALAP